MRINVHVCKHERANKRSTCKHEPRSSIRSKANLRGTKDSRRNRIQQDKREREIGHQQ